MAKTLPIGAVIPALLLAVGLTVAAACTTQPYAAGGAAEPSSDTVAASTAGTFAVALEARNISYNKATVTVPAGTLVTLSFVNDDVVSHNFAVYKTSAVTSLIFRGEIIRPGRIGYRFTAPSEPGTYFFRCDVHPSFMTGDFIVIPGPGGGVTE